jgi:ElaB/YqjD/DUF883 family membrane-anchored ribosome-binding protein
MADQNDKPTNDPIIEERHETPPADIGFQPDGELDGEEVSFDSVEDAPIEEPATTAASGTAQTLKDGAAKIAQTVGDRAKTYVEDGKSRANSALDELAQMINDAAGTVDEKVGPQYGQYARTAAETVTGFSDSLKEKNVDDLIADATAFVKKSPAIAIGTAAALGFVLIRLVQSGLNADNDQA